MTNNPAFLPSAAPRTVLFVAFPDMCLLDLTGPQTVFWAANQALGPQPMGNYHCHTVSVEGGLVRTGEGVEIATQPLSDFDGMPVDTVMLPGSFHMLRILPASRGLVRWLRDVAPRARRVTTVCTGAFLLAEAGLLDGKRAATHWRMYDDFQARFPRVQVDRESIFVRQGPLWTSAGVTAGIDLSLALVEEDCGRAVAMAVALELVVFLKRPGGQSQFSQLLRAQAQCNDTFDELHRWIQDNLASETLCVERLAERACMSPRNFARVYKRQTGLAPGKALERFRLEAARRLLEEAQPSINEVARRCGFRNEERLRTAFLKHLQVTPREYRQRLAVPDASVTSEA